MTLTKCALAASVIGIVVSSASLRASDMIGVYGLVDRVVVEPVGLRGAQPARVQIWGVFALADGLRGEEYGAPKRGYLYYVCPSEKAQTCANEWTDMKSLAGDKAAVGFGDRYAASGNGRVRKTDEAPVSPDTYPIQMGVVKITPFQVTQGLLKKLDDARNAK